MERNLGQASSLSFGDEKETSYRDSRSHSDGPYYERYDDREISVSKSQSGYHDDDDLGIYDGDVAEPHGLKSGHTESNLALFDFDDDLGRHNTDTNRSNVKFHS
jgi:hypothetical protein